jgi:hypothetical protein
MTLSIKIQRLRQLVGTSDLGESQERFVLSIASKTDGGARPQVLNAMQVANVDALYRYNFAK